MKYILIIFGGFGMPEFILFFLVPIIIVILTVRLSESSRSVQKSDDDMSENHQTQNGNPVIIIRDRSNGVGTAGFVFALLGVVFCWAPILNWILCITGLVLSINGCDKEPKALATAGVVISVIRYIFDSYHFIIICR
ncbi:MAG: hypothetical protein LBK58_09450 [Prevotellaceae bacterium]|jgi:hypothetical protein|nr:hypothetical protein [Prevotellaceae bacterium]